MIQNDWLGIQEHTKQFAQQIRAIQILKPSLQLDKSIDPNTDKCTFPPVQKQGTIEKVLQVGLGEQIGRIGKVVLLVWRLRTVSQTKC